MGMTVGGILAKPEAVIRDVLMKLEVVTRADWRNQGALFPFESWIMISKQLYLQWSAKYMNKAVQCVC